MRVLVTGGRDFTDRAMVRLALSKIPTYSAVLVHGAATGADSLAAEQWAAWGCPCEAHPAQWNKYGKSAGPIRNREMLDSGIDMLIAFPGGRGTAHMVDLCLRAGVPIIYADKIEVRAAA